MNPCQGSSVVSMHVVDSKLAPHVMAPLTSLCPSGNGAAALSICSKQYFPSVWVSPNGDSWDFLLISRYRQFGPGVAFTSWSHWSPWRWESVAPLAYMKKQTNPLIVLNLTNSYPLYLQIKGAASREVRPLRSGATVVGLRGSEAGPGDRTGR